jgi:hypothetical protein
VPLEEEDWEQGMPEDLFRLKHRPAFPDLSFDKHRRGVERDLARLADPGRAEALRHAAGGGLESDEGANGQGGRRSMTSVLDMAIAGQIAQRLKLVEFVDVSRQSRDVPFSGEVEMSLF